MEAATTHDDAQEPERISAGWVVLIMINVLVFAALLCVAAQVLLHVSLAGLGPRARAVDTRSEPTMPDEISNVRRELFSGPGAGQQLKAAQRRQLHNYTWVDRERGVIRIPIDVAIELILERER